MVLIVLSRGRLSYHWRNPCGQEVIKIFLELAGIKRFLSHLPLLASPRIWDWDWGCSIFFPALRRGFTILTRVVCRLAGAERKRERERERDHHFNMASPKEVPAELITQEDGDQLRAKALAADVNQLPPGYYTSIRVVGTFVGIGITLIATYFVFEASAAAIMGINADIGPSANTSLMSTVWTVAQPISILIFGRLSDRFGRRNFLLGANLLGIVGAIVCCTAKTFNTLIGGMVLVGLASGPPGSYPLLTGELMSNKTKFLGTICVVIPNIVATGFGPYIGERLNVYASWRWIFYIYIIIMGMCL
jgi:hypothetical protein